MSKLKLLLDAKCVDRQRLRQKQMEKPTDNNNINQTTKLYFYETRPGNALGLFLNNPACHTELRVEVINCKSVSYLLKQPTHCTTRRFQFNTASLYANLQSMR